MYSSIYGPISSVLAIGFTGVKYSMKTKPNEKFDISVSGDQKKKKMTSAVGWSQTIAPFFRGIKCKLSGKFSDSSVASLNADLADVFLPGVEMSFGSSLSPKKTVIDYRGKYKYGKFGMNETAKYEAGKGGISGKFGICYKNRGFSFGFASAYDFLKKKQIVNEKESVIVEDWDFEYSSLLGKYYSPSFAVGYEQRGSKIAAELALGEKKQYFKMGYLKSINYSDKLAIEINQNMSQKSEEGAENLPVITAGLNKKMDEKTTLSAKIDSKFDFVAAYKTKINQNLNMQLSLQTNINDMQPKHGIVFSGSF